MLVCPACGSPNEDRVLRCVRCGAELPQSASGNEGPGTRRMGRTLLGVMPGAQRSPVITEREPSPTATSRGVFSTLEPPPATLSGVQPESPPATESLATNVRRSPNTLPGLSDGRVPTRAGFGATQKVEPSQGALGQATAETQRRELDSTAPPGDTTPVNVAISAEKAALKGTLLGVSPFAAAAIARETPIAENTTAPSHALHKTMLGVAPAFSGVAEPKQPSPIHKGTLLGVAMPGIAPLNPGVQKVEPVQRVHVPSAPPPYAPAAASGLDPWQNAAVTAAADGTLERIDQQRALQRKRLAWILAAAASVLLIIIAAATLVWWKTLRLSVTVVTSESNTEQLKINCSACQPGTVVSLKGRSAVFHNGEATLSLAQKLAIGVNRLALEVKRPNRTRSELVEATVPVEFRVTTDLSQLSKDPPVLFLVVEATPQTLIQIDGRTLTVSPDGTLRVPIDVLAQLTGTNAGVGRFERKLDYTVTQRDGTVSSGSVVAKTGITPLELTAPGLSLITPNTTFTLSGRTSPKAKLTANGHPLAVAVDGTFRQDMALSAPGATHLRIFALEEGIAPRFVEIALERVVNLRQRADELSRSLEKNYDEITKLIAQNPGTVIALTGEVIALETVGPTTRLVVSAGCATPPCLASVRHGAILTMKRGTKIRAIGPGRLTKRATGDERDLTVEASLVVEDSLP